MRELAYNELEEVSGGWWQYVVGVGVVIGIIAGGITIYQAIFGDDEASPQVDPNNLPDPSSLTQEQIDQFTVDLDNAGVSDEIYYQWMQMTGQISFL